MNTLKVAIAVGALLLVVPEPITTVVGLFVLVPAVALLLLG
ncbi:MAG: hypothetical protein ABEJ06_04305 [Haloarculaceae archaeon]